jgi:hypothetical protein
MTLRQERFALTKVVFLNGPPRSGKDTIAEYLETFENVIHFKFAEILHIYGKAFLYDIHDGDHAAVEYFSEEHKNEIMPIVDISYREYLINFSEKYFKPLYGQDIFGRILASKIDNVMKCDADLDVTTICVVSDSGFDYEAKPVVDLIGSDNCKLVNLYRDGCTYEGDSRNYVTPESLNVTRHEIVDNNGSLKDLYTVSNNLISQW